MPDSIRVLHVEDDAEFADMAATFLERASAAIEVATETAPEAALDRLAAEEIDCVVSDYDMPGMDGLEVLDAVRREYPGLPFILFTGKGSEEIASEAISRGVTDYLQKETGTDQYEVLANRIENAVEASRVEREIEQSQHAMDAAWDGIAMFDDDGRFTYVNEAYAETFGHDPDELVGEHWETVYPEDNTDAVYEEILPAVREAGTWTGETRLMRADGTEFVGEHTVAGIDGEGFACVVRDRTDRNELDRELRYQRERFRLLVEAVEEYAMFVLDPEGYVETWNAGAKRILGYEESEIVGEHISIVHTGEEAEGDLPKRLLERAAAEGHVTDEGKRVRKDGSTFWADVTITALRENGDLRGYAKVTKDITERKERERRRERAETYRKRLYEVTTDPDRGSDTKIVDVLQLGTEYLGVEHGYVAAIDPEHDRYEIVAASDDDPEAKVGEPVSLSETYCRRTIRSDDILTLSNAPEQGWQGDPADETYGFGCYLGAKIEIGTDLFGTVCFVDREPREGFSQDEKTFVELLTRWLTLEISRRGGRIDEPLKP